jgi:hypothetical protein
MKKKNYNTKRKKILDNNTIYEFKDEIENDLLNEIGVNDENIVDEVDDDDNIDLVEDAIIEEIAIVEQIVVVDENAPKKRGRKTADKEKFYVEPKKFDEEIMKYYDSGKMSNELAEMVSKISHKLSYAPNFINYYYREEMVGDGVIRMMKALIAQKYNR